MPSVQHDPSGFRAPLLRKAGGPGDGMCLASSIDGVEPGARRAGAN
jgi:hypothetical protein